MRYERAYNNTCTIHRFRDGDTVECFVRCGCCGSVNFECIRLPKIDSWELKSPERHKALLTAQNLTATYRGVSGTLAIQGRARDRYHRIIGDILIDGKALSVQLVERGFAWYGVGEPEPVGHRFPDGR